MRQSTFWFVAFLALPAGQAIAQSEWTERASAGPTPRELHTMANDSGRGRVVLFGGLDNDNAFGDTWEWDGATWTQRATSGPAGRSLHAMAYDSARGRVVLYGGFTPPGLVGDTWAWDGTTSADTLRQEGGA